jgi:hypothetical protein
MLFKFAVNNKLNILNGIYKETQVTNSITDTQNINATKPLHLL